MTGGFAQGAEIAFTASGFRGVVEGVVLAVGEVGHEIDSVGVSASYWFPVIPMNSNRW